MSVLVPNYNYARFLPEALGSVLEQDFGDLEVIVSDDASTDDSAAVIRDHAQRDPRVRFTLQPKTLGLVGNFNWCLAQARGEYIKFLLADDKLLRPDSLRRLVAMLEAGPDIVMASSSAQIINARSELQFVRDYLRRDRCEDGRRTCRRCLLSGVNQIGEPSLVLFRRRCAGTGFNPAYRFWVDVEFALRVLEQGRFAYCREPLAAFRQHEAQQTWPLVAERLDLIEFCQLLLDFAERPWLGRGAARRPLFEQIYRCRKEANLAPAARAMLERAADGLGRDGYGAFLFRRKLLRPFQNLHRSVMKRLSARRTAGGPPELACPGQPLLSAGGHPPRAPWPAALRRQIRGTHYRLVKMPAYRLAAAAWPECKPARKYAAARHRDRQHNQIAPTVQPAARPYDLMLFGIIDWHYRLQRPQHLCREFGQMGYRVFYIEPFILSTPARHLLARGYSFIDSPAPNVFVCQLHCELPRPEVYRLTMTAGHQAELASSLAKLHRDLQARPLVSVVQYPYWRPLVQTLPSSLLVYDCLDHLAGFPTCTAEMQREEQHLIAASDLVVTSSARLAQQVKGAAASVLVRNAAEFAFFSRKPATVKRPSNRPVAGYYGAIAEWFNMDLVVAAARAFPEWDFWLVGGATAANLALAKSTPNILFTGEVPYAELPSYLYGMDVCMIPFLENELTRCTNPVKVYEYLAAGKPVVATPMPELQLMPEHVQVAHSPAQFLAALQANMANPGTPDQVRQRVAWAAGQDWSVRARQMAEAIAQRLPPGFFCSDGSICP